MPHFGFFRLFRHLVEDHRRPSSGRSLGVREGPCLPHPAFVSGSSPHPPGPSASDALDGFWEARSCCSQQPVSCRLHLERSIRQYSGPQVFSDGGVAAIRNINTRRRSTVTRLIMRSTFREESASSICEIIVFPGSNENPSSCSADAAHLNSLPRSRTGAPLQEREYPGHGHSRAKQPAGSVEIRLPGRKPAGHCGCSSAAGRPSDGSALLRGCARKLCRLLYAVEPVALSSPAAGSVVCSGGGPGIMRPPIAARARRAKTIGLTSARQQGPNAYITEGWHFEFHQPPWKFWFAYLARKALVPRFRVVSRAERDPYASQTL